MTSELATYQVTQYGRLTLMPSNPDKHTRYRINKLEEWQSGQPGGSLVPDLVAYRDYLLESERLSPATVRAHLSTIRAQYRRLLKDNATRDDLYSLAAQSLDTLADRKAAVDELVTRLENASDPEQTPVTVITHQDRPDAAALRLTRAQAEALLGAPGLGTLQGLRDTAIIALMLCTGVREAELCSLDVSDLRQTLGGELALYVRSGKGSKARLIPYGELDWCLVLVDKWLSVAGIDSGPVFRGLFKSGRLLRAGRLSLRAVEYITTAYPVTVGGKLATVRPHDLRRTYARRLYESGVDLVAIQQNLGHSDVKTTLRYIGSLGADRRRAPAAYSFDLTRLSQVGEQLTLKG